MRRTSTACLSSSGSWPLYLLPALLATLIADLTVWKIVGLVAVAILIGGFVLVEDSDAFQTLYYRWALPPLPPDETAFIAAADKLRTLRAVRLARRP